jgi:hypothetical protein
MVNSLCHELSSVLREGPPSYRPNMLVARVWTFFSFFYLFKKGVKCFTLFLVKKIGQQNMQSDFINFDQLWNRIKLVQNRNIPFLIQQILSFVHWSQINTLPVMKNACTSHSMWCHWHRMENVKFSNNFKKVKIILQNLCAIQAQWTNDSCGPATFIGNVYQKHLLVCTRGFTPPLQKIYVTY